MGVVRKGRCEGRGGMWVWSGKGVGGGAKLGRRGGDGSPMTILSLFLF